MNLITIENLGKAFVSYSSELHRFARWFGLKSSKAQEKWVLKDISFTVGAGEAVGIIGQNGAGKSTLLKMITHTLKPSQGNIQINGRVAAILELGMGFNADLTGRQNVLHSAGLMGFSSQEINGVMSEIEEFAEIGHYFDEPTRIYSSGMQMRVAFAVATAFRPDVLIVDEALSVGDTYFQHKSFKKIKEFQDLGTTLLIVSHDKNAIQKLCHRAILIDQGGVIKDGPPEEIFDLYNAIIAKKEDQNIEQFLTSDGKLKTVSGNGKAIITSSKLYYQGQETDTVYVNAPITICVDTEIIDDIPSLVMGYAIKDRLGQVCYGTNTWYTNQSLESPNIGETHQFNIHFLANLGVGSYSVSIALHSQETHLADNYDWQDLSLVFNVVNADKDSFQGCNWLDQNITIAHKSTSL
ncbi:ABC transporter ATP-binding protein [Marinomonas sp. 2405UD68-3]|uniref:ABC transporter ATP-binding protein n=1 Tax=Marinomonas sp. 2405UD68-3 TaxID=3391835 RepID=UPI0039C9F3FE